MTTPDRREPNGPIARFFNPLGRYLLPNMSVPVTFLLFFLFNRTRVIGRDAVPKHRNTLLLSNHQTMIDSFLIAPAAVYPGSLVKPFLIPWHPAAEENFFRTRFTSWLFAQFRCIPVARGRRDMRALYRTMRALKSGTLILFPEGTRSRTGDVGSGKPGAGLVILGNQPRVVPVAIDGVRDVLPIGSRFPRFGRRVYVYFGTPMDFSEYEDRERSKELAQEIVDAAMDRIRRQHEALRRLRRRKGQSAG